MQTFSDKRTARSGFLLLAFAGLASIVSLGAATAQQAYPMRANQYYGSYQQNLVSRPVVSSSDVNVQDRYHLPDSYNYDWPYGMGLGH